MVAGMKLRDLEPRSSSHFLAAEMSRPACVGCSRCSTWHGDKSTVQARSKAQEGNLPAHGWVDLGMWRDSGICKWRFTGPWDIGPRRRGMRATSLASAALAARRRHSSTLSWLVWAASTDALSGHLAGPAVDLDPCAGHLASAARDVRPEQEFQEILGLPVRRERA